MKKIDIDRSWLWLIAALAFIVMCFYLSACMTPKKVNKFKELYCRDSVSVVIKDRIVKIPINVTDSSSLDLFLECDSIGNVYYKKWQYVKGQYTALKVQLDKNKMQITGTAIIHDTVEKIVTDTSKFQQVVIKTNELTKSQNFWIRTGKWSFSITLILIVIALVYTFFRFKSKIIVFFKGKTA